MTDELLRTILRDRFDYFSNGRERVILHAGVSAPEGSSGLSLTREGFRQSVLHTTCRRNRRPSI